ncbi:MAG: type II toxin-antitoxin system VapC family toxin, partial [Bryobacteraceae bacterium]
MSSATEPPLLLDTHYWIWLQAGAREHFTGPALKAIERAAGQGNLLLSVISVWELGMLEAKGRIRLTSTCERWVKDAL